MSSPIRPLKSLGQHFLHRTEIAEQIAGYLIEKDHQHKVLEIGPGTGVLTDCLLKSGVEDLYCIEIDERSVAFLNIHYPQLNNRIISDDFLKCDLKFLGEDQFNIIGNFPYNISSQILFRVLDLYHQIPVVVGMFQKEVAQRIASPPGNKNYGILSVLLQAHYDIEYLFTVAPEAFLPPPKVESGVIRLVRKDNPDPGCNLKDLKKIVKTAFNQRRKTLKNSLKPLLPENSSHIPYLSMRPEQLHFSQFAELTNLIEGKH